MQDLIAIIVALNLIGVIIVTIIQRLSPFDNIKTYMSAIFLCLIFGFIVTPIMACLIVGDVIGFIIKECD